MNETFWFGVVVGFVFGFMFLAVRLRKEIDNIIIENTKVVENNLKKPPLLSLEYESNVWLVYNEKTNTFVCQGNNFDELIVNLSTSKIYNAVIQHKDVNGKYKFYILYNGKLELAKSV